MPSGFFLGDEAILHKAGDAALAVPPVEGQRLRQLRGGAAGALADVYNKEQKAKV